MDRTAIGAAETAQRVGLGLALGRLVDGGALVCAGVAGGGVAAGSWPDLNFLIAVTMSLSSRRFSMKRTCCFGMIIGSLGPCGSEPRFISCVPLWSETER
jgi:hypothetical protein